MELHRSVKYYPVTNIHEIKHLHDTMWKKTSKTGTKHFRCSALSVDPCSPHQIKWGISQSSYYYQHAFTGSWLLQLLPFAIPFALWPLWFLPLLLFHQCSSQSDSLSHSTYIFFLHPKSVEACNVNCSYYSVSQEPSHYTVLLSFKRITCISQPLPFITFHFDIF